MTKDNEEKIPTLAELDARGVKIGGPGWPRCTGAPNARGRFSKMIQLPSGGFLQVSHDDPRPEYVPPAGPDGEVA